MNTNAEAKRDSAAHRRTGAYVARQHTNTELAMTELPDLRPMIDRANLALLLWRLWRACRPPQR